MTFTPCLTCTAREMDAPERHDEFCELTRLRRRVETLEGRLARVLAFAFIGGSGIRWMRGRVWSGRRAGRGTKP